MPLPTNHSLDVPGARLHYEVLGTGPVLMCIGHPMGASGFAALAPFLADDFTVVTYDPRGFFQSSIEDPDQDGDPDVLADDVRRILEALGGGPAHVFGSSGGAVTGLALVAHAPAHVRTLVAHEPPVALLLPDAEDARSGMHAIYDIYGAEGLAAAWQAFGDFTGLAVMPQGQDVSPEESATSDRFFAHGLLPIALYEPDLRALRDAPSRVVVAGGVTSRGEFPHRTAVALAEHLGSALAEFPGNHAGFAIEPEAFARKLRDVLA